MSFSEFLDAVRSPALRDIAIHWNAARGTKRMPGWKDIDPAAIAPHLGIVWFWKYDRPTDTFVGRLAGGVIIEALGQNLRGKRMQDFFTGDRYETIFVKDKRVVTEPALVCETGHVFLHANRYGLGERIIMPLAADGILGDGIFGATVYSIDPNAPIASTPIDRFQQATQTVFFALDQAL